jgi:protein-S-isoprenylcysteine O-methyltransferase Ste14
MMVKLGNFLFHYRNGLFPLVYLLLFFKSSPVVEDYRLAAAAGFAVALLGQLLRAVTIGLEYIIRGGRKRQVYAEKLVQGGIFAHCRNPLYVGNFLILVGVGIASNSVLFLSLGVPFFFLAYWAIIAAEENYLGNKFGQEFADYCARVNRLLPNFSGLGQTLAGMTFNWRRLISAEYGSTYIWLAAITLVTLKNAWLNGEYQSNRAFIHVLWFLFLAVSLAYVAARYLKKSGRLEAATEA